MKGTSKTMIDSARRPNNWYVLTGGPGTGKTTTIKLLEEKGYRVAIEHARHYLDTMLISGKTVQEIRRNQIEFQSGILDMQIEQEKELPRYEVVFLDRAIPDSLAYHRFVNIPADKKLTEAMRTVFYKKIFILDPLPIVNDYARKEDEAGQRKIHELLIEVYGALPFPVVHVPVLKPDKRVDFILKRIEKG